MNINFKKIFISVWLGLLLSLSVLALVPSRAFAITEQERCDNFKKQFQIGSSSKPVNIIGDSPYVCSASDLITKVINYLLIMAGTVTVLFIIVGGFWYLTSAGNEEQAEKGKKTLINAVIGLVVIILAYSIVRIVGSTISGL